MTLDHAGRMKEFLLDNKKVSNVSFGTTLSRELLPLKTPHTKAGNEMCLRGVPNLGPGSYKNDETSSFIHELELKPTCKKGYSLGARTAQRFLEFREDFPGPPSFQEIISKPREFTADKKPFRSGSSRFPLIKLESLPGPGTYEHNVGRNRKVQFHGSFGGPQTLRTSIQTICSSDVTKTPCCRCSTDPVGDYYMNKNNVSMCRGCKEDAPSNLTDKNKRFWSGFFKVRDCTGIHSHEGTSAKLRLKTDKDIKKQRMRESYFSLYY
eukprot:TCONS_00014592-protein